MEYVKNEKKKILCTEKTTERTKRQKKDLGAERLCRSNIRYHTYSDSGMVCTGGGEGGNESA